MKHEKVSSQSILSDLLFLTVKIAVTTVLLAVLFLFVFGIHRCADNTMQPSMQYGDLIFYYRLQKNYKLSDVVVLEQDGEEQVRRVVAAAGDEVNITEDGLYINGHLQQEEKIYTETFPDREGISFPVTVGENEYFVLGDNRPNVEDSRLYGTVSQENIKGLVVTFLRRRDL